MISIGKGSPGLISLPVTEVVQASRWNLPPRARHSFQGLKAAIAPYLRIKCLEIVGDLEQHGARRISA